MKTMKRMSIIFLILVPAFFLSGNVSYSLEGYTLPEVLEKVKASFLKVGTFTDKGMRSPGDVAKATYGKLIPVYTLSDSIQEMSREGVMALPGLKNYIVPNTGVDSALIPVYVDARPVLMISVVPVGGNKYAPSGFGDTALANDLGRVNQKFVKEAMSARNMTATNIRFLKVHQFRKDYWFVETNTGKEFLVAMDGGILDLPDFLGELSQQPKIPGGLRRYDPAIDGPMAPEERTEAGKETKGPPGESKSLKVQELECGQQAAPEGKETSGEFGWPYTIYYQLQIQSNWCWDAVTRSHMTGYNISVTQCALADFNNRCGGTTCLPNGLSCGCTNFWTNTTCCNQPQGINTTYAAQSFFSVHGLVAGKPSARDIASSLYFNSSPVAVGLGSTGVGHMWGVYSYSGYPTNMLLQVWNPWSCIHTGGGYTNNYYTPWIGVAQWSSSIRNYGVELAHFKGVAVGKGLELRWSTNKEISIAGWNIYRSDDPVTGFEKINGRLIPGRNAPSGYKYVDRVAPGKTHYYRLEFISMDGESQVVRWLTVA